MVGKAQGECMSSDKPSRKDPNNSFRGTLKRKLESLLLIRGLSFGYFKPLLEKILGFEQTRVYIVFRQTSVE